jgi:hypothetical protein
MTERKTYRRLISPLAQIDAAEDFLGQMESMVADTWREREDPKYVAQAESESAAEFLEELQDEGYVLEVLTALNAYGLRFESDDQEEAEGFFQYEVSHRSADELLLVLAKLFADKVCAFAPDGWDLDDTLACLGWENLIVVPDDSGTIAAALNLVSGDFLKDVPT